MANDKKDFTGWRRWSPSQISTFATCPQRWKYQKVDGLKEPESIKPAIGTAIHERVQAILADIGASDTEKPFGLLDVSGLTPGEAAAFERRHEITRDGADAILAARPDLLTWPAVYVEREINVEICDGHYATGRVDITGVDADGVERVIDIKTSIGITEPGAKRKNSGKLKSQGDIDNSAQSAIYQAATGCQIEYVSAAANAAGDWTVKTLTADKAAAARRFASIAEQVAEFGRMIDYGIFPALPGPMSCCICGFTDICPAAHEKPKQEGVE